MASTSMSLVEANTILQRPRGRLWRDSRDNAISLTPPDVLGLWESGRTDYMAAEAHEAGRVSPYATLWSVQTMVLDYSKLTHLLEHAAPSQEARDVALRDLDEIAVEASELGYAPPTQKAIDSAKYVLSQVNVPARLAVHCHGDDAVGVVVSSNRTNDRKMLVICSGDGSALCLVHTKKPAGRMWTPDAIGDPKLTAFMAAAMVE